jgi:elongation factor 1-alpha
MAHIVASNHPVKLHARDRPIFAYHTAHIACRFEQLIQRTDLRNGNRVTMNPEWDANGDGAVVLVLCSSPLVVETFQEYPALSRTLRDLKVSPTGVVVR